MGLFKKRKIQFTDRIHPFRGILSTIIGVISIVMMFALFIASGKDKGHGGEIYGYLGTFNMLAAVIGFIFGVQCYRMEDIYILYPTVGTVLNGLVSFSLMALYILGMN